MYHTNRILLEAILSYITNYSPNPDYETSVGKHIADCLGIPFMSQKQFKNSAQSKYPGFCIKHMILDPDFSAVLHEPFGTQSRPDLAIVINGRIFPLEIKTSKTHRPIFNSVPPRMNSCYLFFNTKTNKAYGFTGSKYLGGMNLDAVGGNADNLHHIAHQEGKVFIAVQNDKFRMNGLEIYARMMYNSKLKITSHDSHFDSVILNFQWDLVELGDVDSIEECEEDDE